MIDLKKRIGRPYPPSSAPFAFSIPFVGDSFESEEGGASKSCLRRFNSRLSLQEVTRNPDFLRNSLNVFRV